MAPLALTTSAHRALMADSAERPDGHANDPAGRANPHEISDRSPRIAHMVHDEIGDHSVKGIRLKRKGRDSPNAHLCFGCS